MRARLLTLMLLGAGLATAAQARDTDAERMAKALKGYVAGKEVDCISQFPTLQSTTYENAILYEGAGRTLYLNSFDGSCKIGFNNILVTRTYSSQLCRGDIAQIVDPVARFPQGSCVFGKFTTYTRPK